MSRLVTKPTMWLCAQRRLRSVWTNQHNPDRLGYAVCPDLSVGETLPDRLGYAVCPDLSVGETLSDFLGYAVCPDLSVRETLPDRLGYAVLPRPVCRRDLTRQTWLCWFAQTCLFERPYQTD